MTTRKTFREIAERMDPVRPPNRLRGLKDHDYNKTDESKWLQGGDTSKKLAADFGLYHSKQKGLFQVHRNSNMSFRSIIERHSGTQSNSHKLLFYNTYLMDTTFKSYPLIEKRASELGRMIAKDEYDIVCLCEVFTSNVNRYIKENIVSRGNRSWQEAFGPDSDWRNISGGLYGLVSGNNQNLLDYKNKAYSDGGEGADEFANKGWMLMEIDLGPGILDIYVTHADAGKEDVDSRKKQLTELTSAIRNRQREKPKNITMAVGDFNVYSGEEEYGWLLKRMYEICGMRDLWLTRGGKASATQAYQSKCTVEKFPYCACNDYNEENFGGTRLDYVFIQDPKSTHTMNLDFSRLLRRSFPRLKPCGEILKSEFTKLENANKLLPYGVPKLPIMKNLSDHIGLHVEMFSSPKL